MPLPKGGRWVIDNGMSGNPDEEVIRSPQNPRIKNIVRLHDGHDRRRQGLILVEGRRELERAMASGIVPRELYFCPEFFQPGENYAPRDLAQARGAAVCQLAAGAFAKASMREGPDGWLAVCPTPERDLSDLRLSSNPLVVVVEQVEKPGNLGTLMRTAAVAGVDALILANPVAEWFNPNVIRASQGLCFEIPGAVGANAEVLAWLRARQLPIVAASPEASQTHWAIDWRGPTALLLGSEKDGLTPFWREAGLTMASIPMTGLGDSLNVAVAAAVFLFEALRQRRSP